MGKIKQWEWVIDVKLNFLHSKGACNLLGYRDEDLIGTNFEALVRPGRSEVETPRSKWEGVEECRTATGWIRLHYVAELIFDSSGEVIAICGASMMAMAHQPLGVVV